MEIRVQLAGVELGPYSEKQVRQYLAEGLLAPKDSACMEGTQEWLPVREILEKLPLKEAVPAEVTAKSEETPAIPTPAPEPEPVKEAAPAEVAAKSEEPSPAPTSAPEVESAKDEKIEPKPEVVDETEAETVPLPALPLAPAPKVEDVPLPARLVVKSLTKKSNHPTKATHGPVSVAPLASAVANPVSPLSEPIKVLSKKTDPELKKSKTIQMARVQAEPISKPPILTPVPVGKNADPKPADPSSSNSKVEAPVPTPKPAIVTDAPTDSKTATPIETPKQEAKSQLPPALPVKTDQEKPAGNNASISVGELISLAQFLESQAVPEVTASLRKPTGTMAKISVKEEKPAVVSPVRKPTGPIAKISAKEEKPVTAEKPATPAPAVKPPEEKKNVDVPKLPAKRSYLLWVLIGIGLILLLGFCVWMFLRNGSASQGAMKSTDQAVIEKVNSPA